MLAYPCFTFVYLSSFLAALVAGRDGGEDVAESVGHPFPPWHLLLWTSTVTPGWSLFVLVQQICGQQPQRAAGRQITTNPSSWEMPETGASLYFNLPRPPSSPSPLLPLSLLLLPTANRNHRFPPCLSLALLEAGSPSVFQASLHRHQARC